MKRAIAAIGLWLTFGVAVLAVPAPAQAYGLAGPPVFDPPTPTSIGVRLPIYDSLIRSASARMRYRVAGTTDWSYFSWLHRVRPETVRHPEHRDPEANFGGSLVGLQPGTRYEVNVYFDDGDGVLTSMTAFESTTPMPSDPSPASVTTVSDATTLQDALRAVQPGSVVLLQSGTYVGDFTDYRSGTAAQPVVIRAAPGAHVTLQGLGGADQNPVLDIAGDYTHVEDLTITQGLRGIRFGNHTTDGGATWTPNLGAVVRRVTMTDVQLGIASGQSVGMAGAYLCDNDLTGRIGPDEYYGDGRQDWDGITVGSGSMVCHNVIRGFGDAMAVAGDGDRGIDFADNDVQYTYDNAVEADHSYSNVRIYDNRFLNTYAPLSFQPVYGGPVYAFRNVIVRAQNEPFKFHGDFPDGAVNPPPDTLDNPNGVLIYNNTVGRAGAPLFVSTPFFIGTDFEIKNNLFMGTDGSRAVDWEAPMDNPAFDYNGYYPHDAQFLFDDKSWDSLTALRADKTYEEHGLAISPADLPGLGNFTSFVQPDVDVRLSPTSKARNAGQTVYGLNLDEEKPDAPTDLGAIAYGCAAPHYGPRAAGQDTTPAALTC